MVFAWDVDLNTSSEIQFDLEGTATKPLNVTILTNGHIVSTAAVPFCCAACGEGSSCTSTPAYVGAAVTTPGIGGTPAVAAKFIPDAECTRVAPEGDWIPDPTFPVTLPPPGPVQFIPSGYGYAFKADGECDIVGASTVVGDIECSAIAIPGDPCLVGNVIVTGSSTGVGCVGPGCSPSGNAAAANVGVCVGGAATFVGDVYSQGSVCVTGDDATFEGDILTIGNASFSTGSRFELQGQLFAGEDIALITKGVLDFNGGTQVLSSGSVGLVTFMETSW
jgi:hypothetical protein